MRTSHNERLVQKALTAQESDQSMQCQPITRLGEPPDEGGRLVAAAGLVENRRCLVNSCPPACVYEPVEERESLIGALLLGKYPRRLARAVPIASLGLSVQLIDVAGIYQGRHDLWSQPAVVRPGSAVEFLSIHGRER